MKITIIAVSVSALSQIQIFQKEYAKNTRRMQLICSLLCGRNGKQISDASGDSGECSP